MLKSGKYRQQESDVYSDISLFKRLTNPRFIPQTVATYMPSHLPVKGATKVQLDQGLGQVQTQHHFQSIHQLHRLTPFLTSNKSKVICKKAYLPRQQKHNGKTDGRGRTLLGGDASLH